MFCFIISAERPWMESWEEARAGAHKLLVHDAKSLGAVVWNINGKWEGKPERSILGLTATKEDAERIALFLGKRYHQDAVIVCGKLVDPKTGDVLNHFSSIHPAKEESENNYTELAGVGFQMVIEQTEPEEPECPVCGEKGYDTAEECSYCDHVAHSERKATV